MVFGKKKEFHAGDQFGPVPTNPAEKEKMKHGIKEKLKKYAKLLARAYGLAPKDKQSMQNEMIKLNQQLQKLEQEEKIAEARFRVAQTREKINALNAKSKSSTTNYASYFKFPDITGFGGADSIINKDVLGSIGTGKKKKDNLYFDLGL